jgi:hypothetical protein
MTWWLMMGRAWLACSASSQTIPVARSISGGSHINSQGYVVKRTRDDAYDWLFVLDGAGGQYLMKTCYAERRSVSLREADRIGAVAESG